MWYVAVRLRNEAMVRRVMAMAMFLEESRFLHNVERMHWRF